MNSAVIDTLLASVYDVAVQTALDRAAGLSSATGNNIFLKREDLQPIHSFKIRGAYNKISQLSDAEKSRGILAASAGNHAQGVALSAQKLGLAVTIYMPRTTPAIKVDAVERLGAGIVLVGDSYSDAYEAAIEAAETSGQTFIHPFNDSHVIAGQGTVGREICEQLPSVDYIFVPVGGGGLIAGIAQYVKQLMPRVKIIGVEPVDSNAMQASLKAGERVTLPHVGVFADGVAVKYVGDLTFAICQQYVDEVITVSNDQICTAIKYIFEDTRSIVEPAGALSAAGAIAYAEQHGLSDRNIVTICSGANMPFEKLQFIAERTLLGGGTEVLFDITLPEQPGALAALCRSVIADHNIKEFSYRLSARRAAHVFIGISVSGPDDEQDFNRILGEQGYKYQNLSADDIAKTHVRHMVGGKPTVALNEHIYEFSFPERPHALRDFLDALGNEFNISLFHYRGGGGDQGSVLIGFESSDRTQLESVLKLTSYEFVAVDSLALAHFL